MLQQPYEKLNGKFFADFIKEHFNISFACAGPKSGGHRLFVMDNDPSQNSRPARAALAQVECELVSIPARSPDLNPIENTFNLVKARLQNSVLQSNITSESFEQFRERVLTSLDSLDIETINRAIESMPKRLILVVAGKGYRTKY